MRRREFSELSPEARLEVVRTELFPAVVGDVMDAMGLRSQFLPAHIRPVRDDMVVVGRAMPVLEADVFSDEGGAGKDEALGKPFGLMLRALDDLRPGEVYVCAGASPRYALWGGLMSTRARILKASGAVLDGYHRDTKDILALGFPTFSSGAYAQDQGPRGRVIDFRVPVEIGDASIRPGDILFGNVDGVCVIPKETEEETFGKALEKVRTENLVGRAIENGMPTEEAFDRYGIM
ncbi:MAG: RraA family protein [Rubrobacteraceae bacterium]|nr:RraA family protein [Rubrobacteraceae bacterium]